MVALGSQHRFFSDPPVSRFSERFYTTSSLANCEVFRERTIMKHKDIDQAMAANERAELYFAAHPGSPAAVRRPKLSIRSGTWVALLGRGIEDGIVGVGSTVETAFRAFDAQYLAALRPPVDRAALDA
jgi:hypothetical protein